jgi:hypothetical protein
MAPSVRECVNAAGISGSSRIPEDSNLLGQVVRLQNVEMAL